MAKLKILVADSHEMVRLGISFILKRSEDFEVVAEAVVCSEVLQKAAEYMPDVIIMDSHLNEGRAVEVCRSIGRMLPKTKVIMLVASAEDDYIFDAISAGALGLLPRQMKSEELTKAVKAVGEGKTMLDPAITSRVIDQVRNNFPNSERKDILLNPQERRILALIAEGKTNKEIAQMLILSNNTIKNYVSAIFSKLNFSNRAEAAVYAVRHNMIKYPRAMGD